ncbi:tRNA (guanine(37)-N1)-methyltransferase-like isoform X1 [Artemia franciscana]|uniref:tRNA (guanine(37)-N1)-methyltransferase n=2 Tax=Artemia franciscana TaxID=6661 RepID=A0AA88HC51_ARTSF|nr:hypothetical protein QYM36_016977 [Artemia franciscana]
MTFKNMGYWMSFFRCFFISNTWTFAKRNYRTMKIDPLLLPPANVRGMQVLNREAFSKKILVPYVQLPVGEDMNRAIKALKGYILKLPRLEPVFNTESNKKGVFLNPSKFSDFSSLIEEDRKILEHSCITEDNFGVKELYIGYEHFKLDDILNVILGGDEGCKSYTRVGHIIHLNLKDHLLEYRNLIGQVILDKIKGIRCVVNKINTIDNTYRNFQMEIIAGENDMVTTVSENKCCFTFDFSKVYWNSRLSTEHERLVQKFEPKSVIYDVCAGVGPFSIPAAKLKNCEVIANDLNPESVKWLSENVVKNKVSQKIKINNLDGSVFLRTVFKEEFLKKSETVSFKSHIVMNLPAMAVEFLPTFQGIFAGATIKDDIEMPIVHVYTFVKGDSDYLCQAVKLVEAKLGTTLDGNLLESFSVRNVAPNKEMIRVSFRLPRSIIYDYESSVEPSEKKIKV